MMRSWHGAFAVVVVAGCARDPRIADFPQEHGRRVLVYDVDLAPPSIQGAPLEPAREALPSVGLKLVAQWGDDKGFYDSSPVMRGQALSGNRHVVWNADSLLVVDTATGAPLSRVSLPDRRSTSVQRLVIHPNERWIATLDSRGTVKIGGFDGAPFEPLVTPPRAAAPAVQRTPDEDHLCDSVSIEPWSREDKWQGPQRRIHPRLFFSPDGSRLVGPESVWDVATRRPLLTLQEDQALLAVDAAVTRAAVGTLGARVEWGRMGRCSIPRSRSVIVSAAESRDLVGGAAPLPLPVPELGEPVPGFDEPGSALPAPIPQLPVDQVALAANGDLAVGLGDRAWWVDARGASALAWPRPMKSVSALAFTPHGLAATAYFDSGGLVSAASLYGREGSTGRVVAGGAKSPPNRAGLMVVRDDDGWWVWDLRRMERVRRLPDTGVLHSSSLEQAQISDTGAVVLQDADGGATVFLVAEEAAWRRVEVPFEQEESWALAPDGRHVALDEPNGLHVIDLRDGHVRWQTASPVDVTAMVFGPDRLYVSHLRGRVDALSLDGAELGYVDLSARFDHGTALAVSPDGAALAVGTARSRVFVFRAAP